MRGTFPLFYNVFHGQVFIFTVTMITAFERSLLCSIRCKIQ